MLSPPLTFTRSLQTIVSTLIDKRRLADCVANLSGTRVVSRVNEKWPGNRILESFPQRNRRNMSTNRNLPKDGVSTSASSSTPPHPLVVVVLGSTASGKSKLAIDLAKHVGTNKAEIISADSMQVYDGLDILTNKATEEEMQGIPHHMISIVDRTEKFDVVQFRAKALPLVENMLSQGKIPIIVGGTNYYIESLLWKVLIGSPEQSKPKDYDDPNFSNSSSQAKKSKSDASLKSIDDVASASPVLQFMKDRQGEFSEPEITSKWSAKEIHEALNEVDSARALKCHPNDSRKVVRSLQIFFRTGRKHSELIDEQCSVGNEDESNDNEAGKTQTPTSLGSKLGGPLRFPNSICLWIQAERGILNARIDDRVDKMVERGSKEELDSFVDRARLENRSWDFEEGQLQSIGVKEFQAYIELPSADRETDQGRKLFTEGLERLKVVTRQYAKRQVQWINQRFLKSARRQLPLVYGLDGNKTDEDSWNTNVTCPAIQILDAHMKNQLELPILQEKLVQISDDTGDPQDFISRRCEVCDKTLLGSFQYDGHMKSAKHWKVVKRKKRNEEMAAAAALLLMNGENNVKNQYKDEEDIAVAAKIE